MSYAYHAVSSYFNRDNVALPGFVTYFRNASLDERSHAQKLMDFQVLPAMSFFCVFLLHVLSWLFPLLHALTMQQGGRLLLSLAFSHKHAQVASSSALCTFRQQPNHCSQNELQLLTGHFHSMG